VSAATADESALALITFDGLDDDLIVAELQGRAVSTWAYRFSQDGQEVTGLSIAGVEQACRESGRHGEAIRIIRHDWRETDDAYYGTVEAGRYLVAEDGREVLVDTGLEARGEAQMEQEQEPLVHGQLRVREGAVQGRPKRQGEAARRQA